MWIDLRLDYALSMYVSQSNDYSYYFPDIRSIVSFPKQFSRNSPAFIYRFEGHKKFNLETLSCQEVRSAGLGSLLCTSDGGDVRDFFSNTSEPAIY